MTVQSEREAAAVAFSKLSFLALAHSNVFRLLALAFYDPTAEFVQQLISGSYVAELRGYYSDLVAHHHINLEALDQLKADQASLIDRVPQELLKELKVEYARLFIGPGRPAVQPYETFYDEASISSGRPLLIVSPAAMTVEQAYREAGLALPKALQEPPDHIAIELEFLYYLSKKESDGWATGDNVGAKKWRRRELAFIDGHIGRWGQQFCGKVEAESQHSFYRAIAHFGNALIRLEGSNSAEDAIENATPVLAD